jgi:hypothetical protein
MMFYADHGGEGSRLLLVIERPINDGFGKTCWQSRDPFRLTIRPIVDVINVIPVVRQFDLVVVHTKEALIRCCGGSTPELDALPERIGDRAVRGAHPTTDTREAAE